GARRSGAGSTRPAGARRRSVLDLVERVGAVPRLRTATRQLCHGPPARTDRRRRGRGGGMNARPSPATEPPGHARTAPVAAGSTDDPVLHDATHTRYHGVVRFRVFRV